MGILLLADAKLGEASTIINVEVGSPLLEEGEVNRRVEEGTYEIVPRLTSISTNHV
jgi:hypothetical protein